MSNSDEEPWVELRRFDDAVEAEIAVSFLRDHDISAAMHGNGSGSSVFNRFSTIVDIRLMVPRRELEDARAALGAMTPSESELLADPSSAEDSDDDGPYRAKPAFPPTLSAPSYTRRYRSGPIILAWVIPGGGHFYARHNLTGLIVAACVVVLYVCSTAVRDPAALVLSALYLQAADALFGAISVGRFNAGKVPSNTRQAMEGIGLLVAAIGVGTFTAAALY